MRTEVVGSLYNLATLEIGICRSLHIDDQIYYSFL